MHEVKIYHKKKTIDCYTIIIGNNTFVMNEDSNPSQEFNPGEKNDKIR